MPAHAGEEDLLSRSGDFPVIDADGQASSLVSAQEATRSTTTRHSICSNITREASPFLPVSLMLAVRRDLEMMLLGQPTEMLRTKGDVTMKIKIALVMTFLCLTGFALSDGLSAAESASAGSCIDCLERCDAQGYDNKTCLDRICRTECDATAAE